MLLSFVNLFRAVRRKRGSLSKLDTADMRRQAPDQVQVSVPFSCTVPSCEDERSQLVRILVVYQLPQEESGTKHERQHLPEEGGGQRLRRACRAEALRRRRRLPRPAAYRDDDEHHAPNLPCEADAVVLQARPIVPTATCLMCGPLQRKKLRGQRSRRRSQGGVARRVLSVGTPGASS